MNGIAYTPIDLPVRKGGKWEGCISSRDFLVDGKRGGKKNGFCKSCVDWGEKKKGKVF